MNRWLKNYKKVPLIGWVSLIIFISIPILLLLASFPLVEAHSTWITVSESSIKGAQCSEDVSSMIPSSRALNPMTLLLFTFLIAVFLGVELLTKVPSQLHTPLMSGSNAISGITVVGACLAAGQGRDSILLIVIGVLAMICAMINVAGGYLVTDRMLRMFKGKERK